MDQESGPKTRRTAAVREGPSAAKQAAGQLSDLVGKASALVTGGEEPESGSIIVEALPDSLKECCLRVLVWPVHYG